jgi:hypothetical protein
VPSPDEPGLDMAVAAEKIAQMAAGFDSDGPVTTSWQADSSGYDGDILRRFRDGIKAGTILGCPHHTGPLVIWFLAPGCPVGCYPCVLGWLLANVTGTPEDSVCDICRKPHDGSAVERSMIFRLGVTGGRAITITYFVCPACEAIEPT